MKTIINSIMILLILIITGCSEPLPNETTSNSEISKEGIKKMEICCELQDPYSGICQLNGMIFYTHQIIPANSLVTACQTIRLTLDINAVLCDRLGLVHLCWQIKDYSEDDLFMSEDGTGILQKEYSVTNRKDIRIRIAYLISLNSVTIKSVSIVSSDSFLSDRGE
ncbi:MAG: hypothetical protein IPM56_06375 [Ignavibacteriales bacterium]|nr:MAG: hypothetical protein IPM56_06375 [Ignavibacteriales bacterium]